MATKLQNKQVNKTINNSDNSHEFKLRCNKNDRLSQLISSTVVILNNATALMHKSTLNTNNFGNIHFGQKFQKQNILRIFRRI